MILTPTLGSSPAMGDIFIIFHPLNSKGLCTKGALKLQPQLHMQLNEFQLWYSACKVSRNPQEGQRLGSDFANELGDWHWWQKDATNPSPP